MKQAKLIPKETLCQNGCLLLIRFLLVHFALFREIFSFVPANLLLPIFVYVAGLITCNDISATGISLAVGFVSHDAITLMLKPPWWSAGKLIGVAVWLSTKLTGEGWIIIDDTLIPKIYAKLISFCYWDYDHAQRRNVFGIRIVFIVWSNGIITLPVGFYIWHKASTAKQIKGKKPSKRS